jgi:hypothetical protein
LVELQLEAGYAITGGILANTIDPENQVVRYCAKGMEREQEGRHEEASRLFMLAWDQSQDAYERSIAATMLRGIRPRLKEHFTGIRNRL